MSTEKAENIKIVPWNTLGKSGLKVSQYILGCMQYGSKEWLASCEDDEDRIFAILKKAYDHGFRTYDTADMYSNGLSETLLGKFLKKYNIPRKGVVIMTKVFAPMDAVRGPSFNGLFVDTMPKSVQIDLFNSRGLSRKHILDAAKESTERLGTYIDVYQIHRLDHDVSKEEIMRGLNDCVEQGYTRYIGASSMKAVEFVQLQHIADKNGWHKFINMQSCYNLLDREDEHELNYYCDDTGVGLTPYSPLANGFLARPLARDSSEFTIRAAALKVYGFPTVSADNKDQIADATIVNRVQELSEKKNVKMVLIALAWLVAKGVNPIVDISKIERFEDYLNAADVTLTPEEIAYLEEPYKPKIRRF